MNHSVKLFLAVTTLVLGIVSNTAKAYTITSDPNCSVAAAVFNPDYDACVGAIVLGPGENDVTNGDATNIVNEILNDLDTFGVDDWTFMGKQEDNIANSFFNVTGINSTTGNITFDVTAINSAFGPDFLNTYEIAVSFKASQNFSIYQWDAPIWGSGGTAPVIDWSTDGTSVNNNGNAQALSHASVYFRDAPIVPAPGPGVSIPEPSSLSLLALGLIGFGLKRRYSSK